MARAPCNLVATLHLGRGRLISTPLTRRYSNIDNALANIVKWLRRDGFVGDKIVVHHDLTGLPDSDGMSFIRDFRAWSSASW